MPKHITAAVVPVYLRIPLLKYTLTRLKTKNKVDHVIVIGCNPEEKKVSDECGCIWVEFPNSPLGAKWNEGFRIAKNLGVDSVLFVGSSDWLSDNWLDYMRPMLSRFDMIGIRGFHKADIDANNVLRTRYWSGYITGPRQYEPIGIGRLVSTRILDAINWAPFNPEAEKNMDHYMYCAVRDNRGNIGMVDEYSDLMALSISCYKWINKHNFREAQDTNVDNRDLVVYKFPEILEFKKDMYAKL